MDATISNQQNNPNQQSLVTPALPSPGEPSNLLSSQTKEYLTLETLLTLLLAEGHSLPLSIMLVEIHLLHLILADSIAAYKEVTALIKIFIAITKLLVPNYYFLNLEERTIYGRLFDINLIQGILKSKNGYENFYKFIDKRFTFLKSKNYLNSYNVYKSKITNKS
jgi:hypothetical protein